MRSVCTGGLSGQCAMPEKTGTELSIQALLTEGAPDSPLLLEAQEPVAPRFDLDGRFL